MSCRRALILGLFAFLVVLALTERAPADVPPRPGPRPQRTDPPAEKPAIPGRACGSALGLALAGVGMVWGLMWIGTRYADRITRRLLASERRDR